MVTVVPTSGFVDGLVYYGKAMGLHTTDSAAELMPFPRRGGHGVEVVVLFYRASGPRGRRSIRPPDYEVVFGPEGDVHRHGPRSLRELGIHDPEARIDDYRERWNVDSIIRAEETLHALAPRVFGSFRDGTTTPAEVELARSYWKAHLVVGRMHEGPYYEQAGAEFFQWLRRLVGVATSKEAK